MPNIPSPQSVSSGQSLAVPAQLVQPRRGSPLLLILSDNSESNHFLYLVLHFCVRCVLLKFVQPNVRIPECQKTWIQNVKLTFNPI